MIIYKAENIINGYIYIGKTVVSLAKRKSKHKYDSKNNYKNNYFHNALNKYGFDNFKWSIIDTAENEKELNEKEIFWISEYRKNCEVYNSTIGGDGISGWHHSVETKQKMSENRKGEKHPMFGKKLSPEHIEKLSVLKKEKNIGKNNYFYGKKFFKEDNPFYGKTHTDETKKKISEANKKKIITEETRLKMSKSGKGRKRSEDTKLKMSENRKGKTLSYETRKKISENHAKAWMGKTHSEETKIKMSESRKKYWEEKRKLNEIAS